MSDTSGDANGHDELGYSGESGEQPPPADQPGIIVFGGRGGSKGCTGRGCLF